MRGLIRRTLLIGGAVSVAAWVAFRGRTRNQGTVEVPYGGDPRQVFDVTLPAGEGPFPMLVLIHGGGFEAGDKSDQFPPPDVLQAGIAVVRLNYRLSGTAPWPAAGEDCLAAMVYLQRHGAELGLDPARIVLMGQSAGAFLAVSIGLSLVEVGLPPRGVVSFYGPMDFSTMDADMATLGRTAARGSADAADSPESRLLGYTIADNRADARAMGPIGRLGQIREPLPPILIRHGDADPVIADLQSKRLREAWLAADPKAEIDYALLPGAGHGGAEFESSAMRGELLAFLTKTLG